MIRQRARDLGTMGKRLFWTAAGLGVLSGTISVAAWWGPQFIGTAVEEMLDGGYLLDLALVVLPAAMLCGLALGILSWSATYAALGILEARRPEATVLQQAAAGGMGSMAGGLIPAVLIFSTVLSEEPNLGFVYAITFGLLAWCFILAFGTLLVLNRTDASQGPAT